MTRLLITITLTFLLAACAGQTPSTPSEKEARLNALYEGYKEEFPEVRACSVDELLKMREEDHPVVVDVRTPEEWNVSKLPGAITKTEFEEDEAKYEGRPVVLYCTAGYRSGKYAEELGAKRDRVCNLDSGILGWLHAGQPVVDEDGNEVKRVHVYGRKWDLATEDVETVW